MINTKLQGVLKHSNAESFMVMDNGNLLIIANRQHYETPATILIYYRKLDSPRYIQLLHNHTITQNYTVQILPIHLNKNTPYRYFCLKYGFSLSIYQVDVASEAVEKVYENVKNKKELQITDRLVFLLDQDGVLEILDIETLICKQIFDVENIQLINKATLLNVYGKFSNQCFSLPQLIQVTQQERQSQRKYIMFLYNNQGSDNKNFCKITQISNQQNFVRYYLKIDYLFRSLHRNDTELFEQNGLFIVARTLMQMAPKSKILRRLFGPNNSIIRYEQKFILLTSCWNYIEEHHMVNITTAKKQRILDNHEIILDKDWILENREEELRIYNLEERNKE